MALTDTFVKNTKHTGKPAGDKHTDAGGMYLLIKAAGKYWRMDYTFGEGRNTFAMGVYPAVSLAKARQRRDKAHELLADGIDPNAAKKSEKTAKLATNGNTFKAIALEWHETKVSGWSTVHADTTMERMEKNIFPWLGARPLTDIEAPEVLTTLKRIESRGAIDTTHRVKSIMSTVFRYAIATGRAIRNPAADVGVALKTTVKGHHPAITEPKRFAQMLRDIYAYSGSNITRAAVLIHALTFQRPNEIQGMEWAEIDLDAGVWVVPPSRMKGVLERKAHGDAHTIPLSKQAVAVLRDLHPLTGHGVKVFPGERGEGRSISENTARQALRSMGYTDHVPHGFRASARTLIRESLHYDKEVIERQLAHGSDEALGGAYDRTQFLAERAKMMQAWADYLDKLRIGADVIQFKTA
ncbi:MAG: integrase arm-type DNA-binding domain-containing protein [Rhodoferax sp.]|uniref:tyrosine-type recombinase/integrase n=1 Tax=Rhodoferax sp. TaxID=50421 RepID=UPI003016B70D